MSLFCVRLDPPASKTTSWPPRWVKYTRHPAPTWTRSSDTPSPTGSTSPRRPRSSRLIRETTTPRIVASAKWSSHAVNSGSALTMNTHHCNRPITLRQAHLAGPPETKDPFPRQRKRSRPDRLEPAGRKGPLLAGSASPPRSLTADARWLARDRAVTAARGQGRPRLVQQHPLRRCRPDRRVWPARLHAPVAAAQRHLGQVQSLFNRRFPDKGTRRRRRS